MFDRLTDAFNGLFKRLSGNAEISDKNISDAIDEVRASLLDADVNLGVVEDFIAKVRADALGKQVTKSLTPGQEMIGIIHQRLIEVLGGSLTGEARALAGELGPQAAPLATVNINAEPPIMRVSPGPTIVMMCGLQGSGKTTTCGKVAAYLKKRGRSVMLAAADLQRPAAVEQLQTVAQHVQDEMPGGSRVTFYSEPDKVAAYGKAVGVAVEVCRRAVEAARKAGVDTLILDTAGRLHVNDALMDELSGVKRAVQPHHIFLVVDAMSGQDAFTSAKSFHDKLDVDGVVLTKFDSDTRGGAALSVKHVTGAPIKFVGTGEKRDALEEFYADRVAGRILGMGDVVSLVEKAQQEVSQEEAEKLQEKMAKGEMTMDDFLGQMKTLRRMGPFKQLLGLLPGVGSMLKDVNVDEKQLDRVEAIIHSMTPGERRRPGVIDNSRRRRIAGGSGAQQADVGKLVTQFETVSKLTKQLAGFSAKDKVGAMKELGRAGAGGGIPPGLGSLSGKGSTHTPSIKDRFKKQRK